jgi:hypothetical protein
MAAGGGSDDCEARFKKAFEDCIAENCKPEVSCEDRCKIHSLEVERTCLENGGGQDRCDNEARRAYEDCIEENCLGDEPVKPLPFLAPVR